MFNKETLSVADHDSCLQVNGRLSCGRGASFLYFAPRAELRSGVAFRRKQVSCQCEEKLSYDLCFSLSAAL